MNNKLQRKREALNRLSDDVEGDRFVPFETTTPLADVERSLLPTQERGSCPCLFTTPCQPDCTCVNPFMSHGCFRCASYGSLEQRKAAAERIAARLDSDASKDYVRGLEDALNVLKEHWMKYDDHYETCITQHIPDEIQSLISQHSPEVKIK